MHCCDGAYYQIYYTPPKKFTNVLCFCRNPSLGLATKAKGLQGCGPKESPGITSHTPGSVRE